MQCSEIFSLNSRNLHRLNRINLINSHTNITQAYLKHIQVIVEQVWQEIIPVNEIVALYDASSDRGPLAVPKLAIWY